MAQKDYRPIYNAMRHYTETRDQQSQDQLWLVEHNPVYTQGVAGKAEHLIRLGDIPLEMVNRGGQVTYHGPGQIVIYCLLDLERKQLGVKQLVALLEQAMLDVLSTYKIAGRRLPNAPGIYIEQAKIGSVGLRLHRGCCYHGLSFNVDMDLKPFAGINPCGYKNMAVTQLKNHCPTVEFAPVSRLLIEKLQQNLQYEQLVCL